MRILYIFFFSIILLSVGCSKIPYNPEKDVDINLPPFKSELVVEMYLEQPQQSCIPLLKKAYIKAGVTQSMDYFATSFQPFIRNAKVSLTYNDTTVNLAYDSIPEICGIYRPKVFNFKNRKDSIPLRKGVTYKLRVEDGNGRIVTGETQWRDTAEIKSVVTLQDPVTKRYSFIVNIKDNPAEQNYYRIKITDFTDSNKVKRDITITDGNLNGSIIPLGGPFNFSKRKKDSVLDVEISLYHIAKEYFDFLRTTNQASASFGNPFGQPAVITSNLKGGTGILTSLPVVRRRIRIH